MENGNKRTNHGNYKIEQGHFLEQSTQTKSSIAQLSHAL